MKIQKTLKQSVISISHNKGRTFLTILGIIIGIGSVIALLGLGDGVKSTVTEQVSTLGTDNITIMPGANPMNKESGGSGFSPGNHQANGSQMQGSMTNVSSLTLDDLKILESDKNRLGIKAVTGEIGGMAILKVNNKNQRYGVTGTNQEYFDIRSLSVGEGKIYNKSNIDNRDKVVVVGKDIAGDLGGNAIDKEVDIGESKYKVIGVLNEADESDFLDPNTKMYIPYTSAMDNFKSENFSYIIAQVANENDIDNSKALIQNTLLKSHKIDDKNMADFSVNSSKDLLSMVDEILGLLTSLLAGIAAISLLVGGIGIMNIMLVSVTERTREIGLRKAVGAKRGDILGQFIMESIILTLIGGIGGIIIGYAISTGLSRFLDITPVITIKSIALAVTVSTLVGLIFGIYPAAKAAKLNPIDALRYE